MKKKTIAIEIISAAIGSSGYFGWRVTSKYIGQILYAGIRTNLHSLSTPINSPDIRIETNISYSRKTSAYYHR